MHKSELRLQLNCAFFNPRLVTLGPMGYKTFLKLNLYILENKKGSFRRSGGFGRELDLRCQPKTCAQGLDFVDSGPPGLPWPPVDDGTEERYIHIYKYIVPKVQRRHLDQNLNV